MPLSTPAARDVERPQAWANLIAGDAARNGRSAGKLHESLDENVLVHASLERAEGCRGPLKNRLEILFGCLTETDSPTA
jgi:hypothetical protein